MISSIRKAYGAGYRAGMSNSRLVAIGGKRGLKMISEPLNPYRNTFTAPRGSIVLALIWDSGRHDGLMKRLQRRSYV